MERPVYEFIGPITEYRYQFTSISLEEEVVKVVRFTEVEDDVFNLVLLDKQRDGSESNDKTETKNKDMDKVLATVIKIVMDFLYQNPRWFVFIQGSVDRRKRLYQILMNREYERLAKDYIIWGGKDAH